MTAHAPWKVTVISQYEKMPERFRRCVRTCVARLKEIEGLEVHLYMLDTNESHGRAYERLMRLTGTSDMLIVFVDHAHHRCAMAIEKAVGESLDVLALYRDLQHVSSEIQGAAENTTNRVKLAHFKDGEDAAKVCRAFIQDTFGLS